MEIINLKQAANKQEDFDNCDKHKITDIKQAIRNENRVNIFVDDEYSFSLDIAQLVDFKLKIGTNLSGEEIEKYKKESTLGKVYQRTLEWVLTRPRSVCETKDYLKKKQCEKDLLDEEISTILEKLQHKKYIDDREFAKYYVENRFTKKGISKKRLKLELMKKGISGSIINEVFDLNMRNDEEEIKKIITKKRNRYDDEKLINYLVRQGFDFELVRNLVQHSCETD